MTDRSTMVYKLYNLTASQRGRLGNDFRCPLCDSLGQASYVAARPVSKKASERPGLGPLGNDFRYSSMTGLDKLQLRCRKTCQQESMPPLTCHCQVLLGCIAVRGAGHFALDLLSVLRV